MLVLLQSFLGFGSAKITRSGDCSGYKWNVKWMTGGDKQPISISGNTLSGNNVAITASSIQEGGASFNPLRDDFLSTYHSDPQVRSSLNTEYLEFFKQLSYQITKESNRIFHCLIYLDIMCKIIY